MVKQISFWVLLLFGFVKLGSCLRCYKCSGDVEQCHINDAVTETCPNGHNACASLIRNSPSGMKFFFGCATETDCKAAGSVCAQEEKATKEDPEDNPGVSCNATCCHTDRCVKPYNKDDYQPFQCYECHSMDDCAAAKLKTCGSEENRCFKLSTEATYKGADTVVKVHSKGCARQSLCESKESNVFYGICPNDENCHLSCCEGDICNTGAAVTVSALVLFVCAAFATFSQ